VAHRTGAVSSDAIRNFRRSELTEIMLAPFLYNAEDSL
jgi:hypothetical protein